MSNIKANTVKSDGKSAAVVVDPQYFLIAKPGGNDTKDSMAVAPVVTESSAVGSRAMRGEVARSGLGAVRGLLGNRFGDYKKKPFKLKLYEAFTYNTNASGVCTGSIAIDPSTITEFSSAAALFDEYRVVGGAFTFGMMSAVINSATNLQALGVISYDPTDGTALSSVQLGCQLEHHKLVRKPVFAGTPAILNTADKTYTITFRVPSGVLTAPSLPTSVASSTWQTTSGTPQPYGWMKVYFDSLGASATALSGVCCYHVEFRLRA